MKAVVELTHAEVEKYNELQKKVVPLRSLIKVNKRNGYAQYTFTGSYSKELVDKLGSHPTPDEIIIMVDNGFSHFGATCSINEEKRTFSGKVNID